jgi:hypothetical protein
MHIIILLIFFIQEQHQLFLHFQDYLNLLWTSCSFTFAPFCFKLLHAWCTLIWSFMSNHLHMHLLLSSFYTHAFYLLSLLFSFYDTFFIPSLCFSITIDSLALPTNVDIVLSIYLPLAWFFLCVVYLFAFLFYIFFVSSNVCCGLFL